MPLIDELKSDEGTCVKNSWAPSPRAPGSEKSSTSDRRPPPPASVWRSICRACWRPSRTGRPSCPASSGIAVQSTGSCPMQTVTALLVPEVAPYTILLDALSKSFCATGLRVGWGFMPPAIRKRMADILGHVGAWAPKPEQVATAALLEMPEVMRSYQNGMKAKVKERLDGLYSGFMAMKRDGYDPGLIHACHNRTVVIDSVRHVAKEPSVSVVPSPSEFVVGDRFAPRSSRPGVGLDVRPELVTLPGTEHVVALHPDQREDLEGVRA